MFIHFHEDCLKNFSEEFYAPGLSFEFSKIKTYPKKHEKLTVAGKTFQSLNRYIFHGVLKENISWSSIL